MKERKDGGPAFPALVQELVGHDMAEQPEPKFYGGMSLRDYFAAAALSCVHADGGRYGPEGAAQVAAYSYAIAHAMLTERRKP